MNIEPKFKIGQTVYLINNSWYETSYRSFIVKGIDTDYDCKYFLYLERSNGTTYHKEDNIFSTIEEVKEYLIERLIKNVGEKIQKVSKYKEGER